MKELSKKEKLFLSNTRKRVGKAVEKYKLIKNDDNVLVAVSGGKDSLFLLEALAIQRKHFPINFKLQALHIVVDDAPYKIDIPFLEELCKQYDVSLHYRNIELGDLSASKKSPCFVCSWNRRKVLFETTKELGCNKLALGHHMDDAIETLLLNMTYHGNISSMPPTVSMFEGAFEIIRPLLLCEESNILKYAETRKFPDEIELCPFEEKGNRMEMKKLVQQMSELNKNARINLFRSMTNIDVEYLPEKS